MREFIFGNVGFEFNDNDEQIGGGGWGSTGPGQDGTIVLFYPGEMLPQRFNFPGLRLEGRVAVVSEGEAVEQDGAECTHDGSVVCFRHSGKVVVRTVMGKMEYPVPTEIDVRGHSISIGPGDRLDGDLFLVPLEMEAVRPTDTDGTVPAWGGNDACDIDGLPAMPWQADGTMDCSIGNVFNPPTVPLYRSGE